jgi:hypothetical protein
MAAQSSSLTTYNALLKEHYLDPGVIRNLRLQMGAMATEAIDGGDTACGGKTIPFPIKIGGNQGRSATFARAQNNATALVANNFQLTRNSDYGITYVDRQTMLASESIDDAFFKDLVSEVDGIKLSLMQSFAQKLYMDGSGRLGQISAGSDVTTTTITLTDVTTAIYFEIGQSIVLGTVATGASGIRTGNACVVSIQYNGVNAGQLQFASAAGGSAASLSSLITGSAASDYIFGDGDQAAAISGVQSWIPATPPSGGDSFFQVNRSVNSRLYGLYFNGAAFNIVEALQNVVAQLKTVGGLKKGGSIKLSPIKWFQLSQTLQSKGMYTQQPDGGVFGFNSLKLATSAGQITVTEDYWCPNGLAVVQDDNWELVSIREIGHLEEEDIGNYFLRSSNSDSFEVRAIYYAQYGTHAPGWSAVCALPN